MDPRYRTTVACLCTAVLFVGSTLADTSGLEATTAPSPDGGFDFFGATRPGSTAEIFAPGFASTQFHDDLYPVISPDGGEAILRINGLREGQPHSILFFTRRGGDGVWSPPRPLPFLTDHRCGGASYSPDGSRLYFASRRPLPHMDPADGKTSLWFARRTPEGWGEAEPCDSPLNAFNLNGGCCLAADGTFYAAIRAPGRESHDIYEVVGTDCRLLPGGVNTPAQEVAPYVDSNAGFMLFTSVTAEGLRIRLSIRDPDGDWTEPETVDELTAPQAKFVTVSPDGNFLMFVSHRQTAGSNPQASWPVDAYGLTPMADCADILWMEAGFLHERVATWKARPQVRE